MLCCVVSLCTSTLINGREMNSQLQTLLTVTREKIASFTSEPYTAELSGNASVTVLPA